MTVVVAIETGTGVVIGADSAGVAGLDLIVRADEKVFHRGPMIMGFTASFRMGQLLRYQLEIPKHPKNMDDHEYMSTVFIDSVRSCLSKGGYAKKTNEQEEAGTFLAGYKGRVYTIESDYQVGKSAAGYDAVGCGAQIALGAMHATDNSLDPEVRIRKALDAAEAFSAGVRGPFMVLSNGDV